MSSAKRGMHADKIVVIVRDLAFEMRRRGIGVVIEEYHPPARGHIAEPVSRVKVAQKLIDNAQYGVLDPSARNRFLRRSPGFQPGNRSGTVARMAPNP